MRAKIVNPGGVEIWKQPSRAMSRTSIRPVDHFGVTPRQIIESVAEAVDELGCRTRYTCTPTISGLPGNWTTTLETMKALEGHRAT